MALRIRIAVRSKEELFPGGRPLPKDGREIERCDTALRQCLPQGTTGIRRRLVEEEVGHFLTGLDHHDDLRAMGACHDLEIGQCLENEVKAPSFRSGFGEDGCQLLWPDPQIL